MGSAAADTIPKPYFRSIDGLRLVASANIVLYHLEKMGGLNDLGGAPGWLFLLVKGPAFHASLFFLLGGFIYGAKYGPIADTFRAGWFLKRRLRALYPLHALTTLSMVPLVAMQGLRAGADFLWPLVAAVALHLGLVFSIAPYEGVSLNTPSWALSSFFLCYLCLGPTLRIVKCLRTPSSVVAAMALCLLPSILWSELYGRVGTEENYLFFHVFAPLRLFEFVLGILLSRLYLLNNTRPRRLRVQDFPLLNDLIIVVCVAAVYLDLQFLGIEKTDTKWISYHMFMVPLYATILYRMARGNGLIARFFGLKAVRDIGMASFYPYLLHIPLASWIGWTCEDLLGYNGFFHSPLNIAVFMVCLYGGSAAVWRILRGERGEQSRRAQPAMN